MNSEIVLRLRYQEGQNRLIVKSSDTYGEFLIQVARACNYLIKDLIVQTQDNKIIQVPDGRKLYQVPYFKDGAIFKINTKNPGLKKKQSHGIGVSDVQQSYISSKCNHPSGGKCLNCIGATQAAKQQGKDNKQEPKNKPKCNHGPGGRCLNCTEVDLKNKETAMKWMCQHPANSKCLHCLDKQFISEIAHISFDQYLQDRLLKCKGVHPKQVKCGNCLAPSEIRYQVDKSCKNHEPYPKAMCNKCIPPNVVIKRQQYRHVDYVEFMNVDQLSKFVKNWVQKKKTAEQMVGFLYGYYAQDPHYKNGIRVIVQAIYTPKQKGTYNSFQITQTEGQLENIDRLVQAGLGLQKIGWIFTENNHDVVMSQTKVRMAARYQQMYQVNHSSGYPISNFITVVLRGDEKNHGQVKPEVYMISDQGQALEKYSLFEETSERKLMKMRVPKSEKQALPGFICGGKNVTEFEPEFLLVKIAHGSSRSNRFAYLKSAQFPSMNQEAVSKKNVKDYLKNNKHKKSFVKYADFNLLVYLSRLIDIGTAISIANCVQNEVNVEQHLEDFVAQMVQL